MTHRSLGVVDSEPPNAQRWAEWVEDGEWSLQAIADWGPSEHWVDWADQTS